MPVSRASWPLAVSGCSRFGKLRRERRWGGRPTRSTLSAPRAACSPNGDPRSRAPAANAGVVACDIYGATTNCSRSRPLPLDQEGCCLQPEVASVDSMSSSGGSDRDESEGPPCSAHWGGCACLRVRLLGCYRVVVSGGATCGRCRGWEPAGELSSVAGDSCRNGACNRPSGRQERLGFLVGGGRARIFPRRAVTRMAV